MGFNPSEPFEDQIPDPNNIDSVGFCDRCHRDTAFCSCICEGCGKSMLEDGNPGDALCFNCYSKTNEGQEELAAMAEEDRRDREWRQARREYAESYEDAPPSMDEPGGSDWNDRSMLES